MNNKKMKKAEYLLSEIGEIDSRLLDEAVSYKPKKAFSYTRVVVAACLAVIFAVTVLNAMLDTPLLESVGGNMSGDEAETAADTRDELGADDSVSGILTLDSLLADKGMSGYATQTLSADTLPYFDGQTHIVWQRSGEERYYVSEALTAAEIAALEQVLGVGDEVGDSSPDTEYMVWILCGDGNVVSPYLKESAGNVGVGVFDYDPEIIPDEKLIREIEKILT